MMKSGGLLFFLTKPWVSKGFVLPNPRSQRSLRLAASVQPSKGRDDEIRVVMTEIVDVQAKIDQINAALGGRRNDAGKYAFYVSMGYEKREADLMPQLRALRNLLSQLQELEDHTL